MKNRIFKTFKLNKLVILFLAVGFFSNEFYGFGTPGLGSQKVIGRTDTTGLASSFQVITNSLDVTQDQVASAAEATKTILQNNTITGTQTINSEDSNGNPWVVEVTKNADGSYSTSASPGGDGLESDSSDDDDGGFEW